MPTVKRSIDVEDDRPEWRPDLLRVVWCGYTACCQMTENGSDGVAGMQTVSIHARSGRWPATRETPELLLDQRTHGELVMRPALPESGATCGESGDVLDDVLPL